MSAAGEQLGSDLIVAIREKQFVLRTDQRFTFGRAESCTCCLDSVDRGISRIAGALVFAHGTWWVVNRSETRALHVVDSVGLSVPLPVARSGWPASRRAVEPAGIRILVAGAVWTHELRCTFALPQLHSVLAPPESPSTATQAPSLTDARKEALVALVSGYLKPFPRYDPRPLTYAEIADMLGLPRSTVKRRVEAFRTQLREAGVPGLDEADARRPLAEFLLSMRLIVAADLEWLRDRQTANETTSPHE